MSNDMQQREIAFYSSGEGFGSLENNILHFIQWLDTPLLRIKLISHTGTAILQEAQKSEIPTITLSEPRYKYFSVGHARMLAKTLRSNNIVLLFVIRPRDILTA